MKKVSLKIKIIFICIIVAILAIICLVKVGSSIASNQREKVILYETVYYRNAQEIDINEENINITELIEDLSKFNNLEIVNFRKTALCSAEMQQLKDSYPTIQFNASIEEKVFNTYVPINTDLIDLSNDTVDNSILEKLSIFKKLKKVIIVNNNLSINEIKTLIDTYPNISFTISLEYMGLKFNNKIEELDLSNRTIENKEEFQTLLSIMQNLKFVNMCYTNYSNEELDALNKQFPDTKIVWMLQLGKWKLRTDAVAFSVLITQFDYKRLTSDDIQILKYCTDLRALDLGHQSITDISVIGEYLPELRVLILADNKISDISPLKSMKNLHFLELFMNQITDFSPLKENTELVDLNISFNPMINDFTGLLDFKKLERLWVVNCVSYQNFQFLKEHYSNAIVNNSGPGSTEAGWRQHERYFKMINMYYNNYIDECFTKYDI